jgi:hypothetical protein
MVENGSKKLLKVANSYCCDYCYYNTSKKSSYDKHLSTDKHKNNENGSKMVENDSEKLLKVAKSYKCICGKIYKYDSGYYRHKKKCLDNDITNETIIAVLKQNSELQQLLMSQNKTIIDLSKNNQINTNNTNTNTNNSNNINNTNHSHNKTFNLQFFLNETCKDAMNIMDFVDSIKLQLSDLERVGDSGFVNGISNIIIKNLKDIDVTKRPVHCTDKKREVMYVKDADKWEKDIDNNKTVRKAIKHIAHKNVKMLNTFKEKYPDCLKSESKHSDKYNKIVIESFGGSREDNDNENKIITQISKVVSIDKHMSSEEIL